MNRAATPYNRPFYEAQREGSRRSARRVVPIVLQMIQPQHVVDVGCGVGTWLSVFRECGVENVLGIDGDYVGELLEIPRERFFPHDLRTPVPVTRQFDLVVSLEVAEHLPPECAERFVESLTRLGPVTLFSAAIPFQGGTDHLNEQWPEYWAALFDRHGFVVIDAIRPRIWQDEDVEWWYAQNTLLFVRREALGRYPALTRERETTHPRQLSIVHPRKYLVMVDRMHRAERTRRELAAILPPRASIILVDEQHLATVAPAGRPPFPFLECDGRYWGPPLDDETAIRELERLRQAGSRFIIFAWPAFWWLDHYPGLASHLRSSFRCLLENDRVLVFDLEAQFRPRSA